MCTKQIKFLVFLISSFFLISVSFADFASDSVITGLVKSKFATDPVLSGNDVKISVSTKEGIVFLKGVANTELQANTAVEDAQAVSGVKDVNTSGLSVKSSDQPFTDSYITAKVKGKFIQEKLISDDQIAAITITVETNNGVVALGGSADNAEQARNAVRIAKSVSGVKEVKSNIKLAQNENE